MIGHRRTDLVRRGRFHKQRPQLFIKIESSSAKFGGFGIPQGVGRFYRQRSAHVGAARCESIMIVEARSADCYIGKQKIQDLPRA